MEHLDNLLAEAAGIFYDANAMPSNHEGHQQHNRELLLNMVDTLISFAKYLQSKAEE